MKEIGFSTRSVHQTEEIDPATRSIESPIVLNSAFAYDDLESWLQVALKQRDGHIYSRNTNPTSDRFESKMAALEGVEAATSFTTGMAAINATLLALLKSGQRVVSIKDSYGATYLHFDQILPKFGIECKLCETEDYDQIESEIEKGCDLVYLESPTNPTLKVVDIARMSKAAKKVGAITVVDNTFASPINQNPAQLGADLIIHSATKYICGHNDTLGGVVCGSHEMVERVFRYRELAGSTLQSFEAYLLHRSLKTLALRVQRQNENAMAVAAYLDNHPKVNRVFYPGLSTHPNHDVAARQMRGFGGMLSFDVVGGMDAIKRFLPRLRFAYMAANLGQVMTVVGPPATTSHVECTEEERAAAGIPEGLVRYSAGIEDIDDLIADLEQALEVV